MDFFELSDLEYIVIPELDQEGLEELKENLKESKEELKKSMADIEQAEAEIEEAEAGIEEAEAGMEEMKEVEIDRLLEARNSLIDLGFSTGEIVDYILS